MIVPEFRENTWNKPDAKGRQRRDAKFADPLRAHFVAEVLDAAELQEQIFDFLSETESLWRRQQTLSGALEKAEADICFEIQ